MNASGLYLFSGDGSTVVMHVSLNLNSGSSSEFFRFGRFGFDGRFKIVSFINGGFVEEFIGPSEICQILTICGKLKLCSAGTCSCPQSFTGDSRGGCVPADSSVSLASSCGNISNMDSSSSFSYLRLMKGVDYFANTFMEPVTHVVDLKFCKDLCSKNCSCLGLFYEGEEKGFHRWRMLVMLQWSDSSSSVELEMSLIPVLPIWYSYNEIATAINNLKTQIGSGGFGIVYKGTLPDKTIVEVKKITSFRVQGRRNFCAEIGVIGNIHHVNLVRLKGFCLRGRHRLLVLEYMNRGSLDEALFGDGDDPVLEWKDRFQITMGTARGLAYLHSGCDHKIIHCDVKPENILLNDSLGVKISDFGLSKLPTPEQSGLFTTLRGTKGYLAPEWLTGSTISDKTDAYSFGMVLLEIVRGRKNWLLQEEERVYFPLLALQMHMEGRYLESVDPRLEGKVRSDEVEMLVRVGLCCVHEDPALRPTMANVVGMLEGRFPMADPIVESLSFLYLYGRRFTDATMVENLTLQDPFTLQRALDIINNIDINKTWSSHNREMNNNDVISTFSYISYQQVSSLQ
ncbi:G-type lectin S-receptor-like serine/threonine-protein kinase [Cucumis melo var. makuwa]|nr:G-type lectin S-receptor-like serine/threonine-protein kinase [Cucumis melo var. makuwa]